MKTEQSYMSRQPNALLAFGECFLILPASLFLAAALLRVLQPPQREPARMSWIAFNWAAAHISHAGAAVIFLAFPAIVLLAGVVALFRAWQGCESFRQDVFGAIAILGRNFAACVLAAATALGGLILAAVVVHLILG